MKKSECLINNLIFELESLASRIRNINQTYWNTYHNGLRERLIFENKTIHERINQITSIAELLKKRSRDEISLSNLLQEKCRRINLEINIKRNLFFL
tara:strand:+ start:464 stop:754 length:291 start_codon:yes stop_codon:yes gene_type:complete